MALPVLTPSADIRSITERVNVMIRDYNRPDMRVPSYADDTGSATAYAIAPGDAVYIYQVGQIFAFKAANANSGTAPTLNVNGLGAGTITYPDGSALVPGDIPANGVVAVTVASTTPTFHLVGAKARGAAAATTSLGANVALNNTANFFSGPNTGSIGAAGQKWFIFGHATMTDTAGAAGFALQIHDGTTALQRVYGQNTGASGNLNMSLGLVVALSAATTFTLQARDLTSANGTLFASDGTLPATAISAVRLA